VLIPTEIAKTLADLLHHPYLHQPEKAVEEDASSGWQRIQKLLKVTGHDFS